VAGRQRVTTSLSRGRDGRPRGQPHETPLQHRRSSDLQALRSPSAAFASYMPFDVQGFEAGALRMKGVKMTLQARGLTPAIFLCVGMAASPTFAFDPDAVERLKSKSLCVACDLSGASLKDAYLPGAVLKNSNLTGADLRGANFNGADLSGTKLVGADLAGSSLEHTVMSRADLSSANLSDSDMHSTNLEGANLTSADLRGSRVGYMRVAGARLDGANLLGALGLEAAQLAGAILCKTTLPEGRVDDSGCQ